MSKNLIISIEINIAYATLNNLHAYCLTQGCKLPLKKLTLI